MEQASGVPLSEPVQEFVAYFGELGARWGLEAEACRVHACLYVLARPVLESEIEASLGMTPAAVQHCLRYLTTFGLVEVDGHGGWRTSADPWDLLTAGLQERRKRELGPALATLRRCHGATLRGPARDAAAGAQIAKVLTLVEELAAIDLQASRLSPRLLRGVVRLSGRAARALSSRS